METVTDIISLGSKIMWTVTAAMKLKKTLAPRKKSYDNLRQCIKEQKHHFDYKGPYSQSNGFSSSYVHI